VSIADLTYFTTALEPVSLLTTLLNRHIEF